MNSNIRIAATLFPRDMVCLRNISVDTLTIEDTEDNNNNNNNNNTSLGLDICAVGRYVIWFPFGTAFFFLTMIS